MLKYIKVLYYTLDFDSKFIAKLYVSKQGKKGKLSKKIGRKAMGLMHIVYVRLPGCQIVLLMGS